MSGEGAEKYLPGSNVADNRCHRATSAHPYLVAKQLGMRLVFAACSGATTQDFYSPQHAESPSSTYGGVRQLDVLDAPRFTPDGDLEPGLPAVLLIGIGGNDAEFGDIIRGCLDTDCRPGLRAQTARLDSAVQQSLATLFADIRAKVPDSVRVLVMTYPQPVVDGDCVPGFSRPEIRELTTHFLPRLNDLIRFQAIRPGIGFEVVEAENALVGARLCESQEPAMNGLRAQPGSGGSSANGSMHPNEKGHQLLAKAVLAQLAQPRPPSGPTPPPPPSGSATAPPTSPQPVDIPPPPGAPPGLPPGPTDAPPKPDSLPPGSTVPVPATAPCFGPDATMQLDNVRPLEARERTVTFTADPGSLACISVGSEDWDAAKVPFDGNLSVDSSRLSQARVSTIQVIRLVDGGWRGQVLTPPPESLPGPTNLFSRASTWVLAAALAPVLIGLPLWWLSCRRRA
jgi:lysophospholipase L1-like esterase